MHNLTKIMTLILELNDFLSTQVELHKITQTIYLIYLHDLYSEE
jgi:hypothetical protein